MVAFVSSLLPIFPFTPQAPPSLFNTPPCISGHPTKEIFQSLSTGKSQCLPDSYARRSNFSRRVSNTPNVESSEAQLEKSRPTKSYTTTLWGNYFHSFTPDENEEALEIEHQILKEDLRRELLSSRDKPLEHLKLIDTIERLGVAYHFKDEIEESLAQIYHNYNTHGDDEQFNLYHTSLRFRILRQHGFYVSSDCFKKFTNEDETFSESLATDTLGILSLFEASHVRVYREDILEKALLFTTRHLTKIKMQNGNPFFEEVNHALSRPLQKSLVRLEAKHHIMRYRHDPLHNATLLKFAKVDFNILQSLHKKELQELTRWWEDLRYGENFRYARDRLVEGYFIAMVILFEPKYSLSRIVATKLQIWLAVTDDLYDLHGTRDELRVFTEAVERWDKSYVQQLPDYMKVLYEGMLDDINQYGSILNEAGSPNYLGYLIEEVKDIIRADFKAFKCREAKVNAVKYEEYVRHGMVAVGPKPIATALVMAMGAEEKEEDLECLSLLPNALRNACIITKLLNDIVGYETDKDEGGVSSVYCYMEQYGVSKEEACAEIREQIEGAWIDMNEEMCLYPRTRLRKLLCSIVIPMAQVSHSIYDGEDGFRMVKNIMKDYISRTLVEKITY